jgi:hypothetical protein
MSHKLFHGYCKNLIIETYTNLYFIILNYTLIGEKRNAFRILFRKPEGKKPLGRPRRRWVNNIKIDLREIGWDDMA